MKHGVVIFILAVLAVTACSCKSSPEATCPISVTSHPSPAAYEGWRLGVQAYTFRKFTFFEAVDKAADLGLYWIEAYPSQVVCEKWPVVKFSDMNPMQQVVVKRKLNEAGVTLVNYGVVDIPKDETECRQIFEFAKVMGVATLTAEPRQESLDMVDRLCQEYQIQVAIHNHPKPSRYWDPAIVAEACKGRSQWIGACVDTGHWPRSGIDSVEGLKKLEGRILALHFKDLNEFGNPEAHDVPWGTGVCNVRGMLEELHRQGFKGVFSIEYEHHWDNSVPEIRQSVEYFNKVASELAPSGWKHLLADGLACWNHKEGNWKYENGVLERVQGSDCMTSKERYGDFVFDLQFKLDQKSNSGAFFRISDLNDLVQTGMEAQIFDSFGVEKPSKHDCGAIYDCLAPSVNAVRPPGEWNRMTVTAKANKIYVVLNGRQVIDMDLNQWTEGNKNPDGTKNKFKTTYKDMPREGHLGLQNHNSPIAYRNVWVKSLD